MRSALSLYFTIMGGVILCGWLIQTFSTLSIPGLRTIATGLPALLVGVRLGKHLGWMPYGSALWRLAAFSTLTIAAIGVGALVIHAVIEPGARTVLTNPSPAFVKTASFMLAVQFVSTRLLLSLGAWSALRGKTAST